MTRTSRIVASLAAASLAVTPVMASAATSASEPVASENDLGGGNGSWLAIVAVIGVVALAIIAATNDGNDNDNPVSP